jgi:hypothetical protein
MKRIHAAQAGTRASTSRRPGGNSTLLGRGSEFEGKLTFEGTVRVEGKIRREICSDDVLVIGEGAVQAEISVGSSSSRRRYSTENSTRPSLIAKGRWPGARPSPSAPQETITCRLSC